MNTPLTNEVSLALAWWQHGCLTGDALVAWVDRRILAMDEVPDWMFLLSIQGPHAYLKTRDVTAPGPRALCFEEAFRARVESTDPLNPQGVEAFMRWLINAAMGESQDTPGVAQAYEIDHVFCDMGQRDEALELTRSLLKAHRPTCRDIHRLISEGP